VLYNLKRHLSNMTSVDDYISQAIDLLNENNVAAAIQKYREALKIDPEDPTALTGLGAALDESGQLENAIDCYRKALSAAPDNVIAHSGLGVIYEKQGDTDQAAKEYKTALSADQETAFLHIVYARDRYTKSLLKDKEQYEAQIKQLDEHIGRYISVTKIVDEDVSEYFPK
jgi:Flp pilus assembly protein TadD